ncbi:type II toxin-antitoxin system RelE family toxin [Arcobacter sp.]|jgi:mRNA interferase RelE/StbE|uniref:type II toxin-antitoxin system RelE family toxin n=1 Tax=Arcobacter TaxID=28196 RepID=UPI002A759847|nr:type II toxin-antitoxin system RelE/ParE family toxin [Arcobacter sp.]MDY3204229.1 type II toxin-antitoxin system RelE/ParE family toxin [Arcobacter sp.]
MLIDIQDSAYKDLKKIDKSDTIKILQTIKKLEDYPNITNVKKLTNHYPPFRLRIGDYRVLFDIEEDKIIVSNIKHRKKAY